METTSPGLCRVTWRIAIIVAAGCVAAAGQVARQGAAPSPLEAVQKAQIMIAGGKQAEAVRFIDQQLLQRQLHAAGDERYQLLMLKGDALIQTNKPSTAATVFDQARRAAPNGQAGAVARACALLVRASPSGKYVPKRAGSEPIDIVHPDSRRAALEALRADLVAAAKPKMAQATKGKTLPPALDLLPAILDIASVELASKGSTEETQADVASLGEHSRGLMHAQIQLAHRWVNALGDRAHSTEEGDSRRLFSKEEKELRLIIAELRQIEKAARDVRVRAREVGVAATAWEQIAVDAADVADAAERVLEFGSASTRN